METIGHDELVNVESFDVVEGNFPCINSVLFKTGVLIREHCAKDPLQETSQVLV